MCTSVNDIREGCSDAQRERRLGHEQPDHVQFGYVSKTEKFWKDI